MNATTSHPAPHRRRVSGTMLLLGLLAAPAAWFVLELGGWGMASYHCGATSAHVAAELTRANMPSFVVLTVVAFGISLSGTALSWQAWLRSRHEKPGSAHDLAQLGKGRTRFVALASLIASATFTVALLFYVIQMWLAPLCGA